MTRALALLLALLASLPAAADMYQDARNAELPAAPHNLGLSYAVKPGGDVQAALTAAAATGGTVNVQAGAYAPTTSLVVSSNTRIVCEPGAIFTVTNTGWSGPTVNGLNTALFINQNHAAASITDENISIEGCGLVATGTFAANSNYFHIYMRMARNVTVARNNFTAGGNAVSFLGTDKTLVEQNNATDTRHCWDHWEAPTRAKVYGGTCMNAFSGCCSPAPTRR